MTELHAPVAVLHLYVLAEAAGEGLEWITWYLDVNQDQNESSIIWLDVKQLSTVWSTRTMMRVMRKMVFIASKFGLHCFIKWKNVFLFSAAYILVEIRRRWCLARSPSNDGGGGDGGDSDGDCDGGDGDGARSPKENIFQVFCRQRLASKESFLIRFQMEFALELLIKGEHSLNH